MNGQWMSLSVKLKRWKNSSKTQHLTAIMQNAIFATTQKYFAAVLGRVIMTGVDAAQRIIAVSISPQCVIVAIQ